ncbi:MAG TPA: T9SS type A sorting domain-containing protein [Saprospiraceae bacterium]|nr:T9SS type A sorting domain-containing protein [Saprospiraceae bacterium]
MKSIFILLSVFFSFQSFGQVEFAPQGAEWHIGTTEWIIWGQYPSYGLLRYKYEGGSFPLGGYEAKALSRNWDGQKDTIAQDGDKIFLYHEGEFVMIYDFGKGVGDTLSVPNWALWDNAPVDMIVTQIDTVEINGTSLVNFTYDVPSLGPDGSGFLVANNKLGGYDVDILHPLAYVVDYPLTYKFRCYSDDAFGFYKDSLLTYPCEAILLGTGDDLENRLSAKIYPNPVSSNLYVEMEGLSTNGHFQIIDLLGRKMMGGLLTDAGIDVRFLPKGLYLIELGMNDGGVIRQQFVKQ